MPTGEPTIYCTFRVPYPPSVNRMYKRVPGGRVIKIPRVAEYQERAGWEARSQGAREIDGALVVTLDLYRPNEQGDADNAIKVLLDALEGVAYANDRQIEELHVYRHTDAKDPRVEVGVARLDVAGLTVLRRRGDFLPSKLQRAIDEVLETAKGAA